METITDLKKIDERSTTRHWMSVFWMINIMIVGILYIVKPTKESIPFFVLLAVLFVWERIECRYWNLKRLILNNDKEVNENAKNKTRRNR